MVEALGLTFADLYDERNGNGVPGAVPLRGRGTAAPRHLALEGGFDKRKFRVLDAAKMIAEEPPEVPWQIEGLAVRGDVTVLTGDPGAGKSLLALTLASAVARGESIAGIGCTRGSVIYLDAENGAREIHRRLHSLGVPDTDVTVVEADGVDLRDHGDFVGLEALVEHCGPSLLVLDSLTALWPGANERRAEDVAPTLYELKRLAERHGVAIQVLHHRPKDGGEYRGTTAIAAAAQLGFTLSRVKEDPEDRWLHLGAERGMVLVGVAEPYRAADEPKGAPAPRRDGFVPQVLAALDGRRLGLAGIADAIGANPKDGSLRRAVNHLVAGGEIVRGDDKKYGRCRVPGATGPRGAGTAAPGTPLSRAESGNGHQADLEELADVEIARLKSKGLA